MNKTSLFIFDGLEEILLSVFSNKDNKQCPFIEPNIDEQLNGDFLFEFMVPANHEDSIHVKDGNLVVFKDLDGNHQLFQIYKTEEVHEDNQLMIHAFAEHGFYEIADDIVEDLRTIDGTATDALTKALSESRWDVGNVDSFGNGTVTFYYSTGLDNIQRTAETFGGELGFRVEITGSAITGRFVDLLVRRGADTGNRFEWNKDLTHVKRTVDRSGLKTALYGRGKGEEIEETGGYTRKVDFADEVWTTPTNPVDKPALQEWIGLPSALALFGRDNGTKHRVGVFEYDTTDPAELIQKTYEQLLRVSVPRVTYELNVIDLEHLTGYDHKKVRLGDTVFVIDRDLGIRIEARVVQIKRQLDNPEETEIVLGNFIEDITDYNSKIEQLEATITDRKGVWDKADNPAGDIEVDDSNIIDIAPEIPANVNAIGLFKTILTSWTYEASIRIAAYELYGSTISGFTPDSSNLLFRGKVGGFVVDSDTNTTWYFRVRAINPHGTASAFTSEFSATTLRIDTPDFELLSVTDAIISDVSADKLTVGTIDANNIDVINLNAGNITVGLLGAEYVQIGSTTTYEVGYDPAEKATNDDMAVVAQRVAEVEFLTLPDSIISTVRASQSYLNDLEAKANSTDLENYASTDEMEQTLADANSYTDTQIGTVNTEFSTVYEQISQVDQKADNIDFKFTSSGGVNLLKNSAGYSDTDFWNVTLDVDEFMIEVGFVDTIQNAELIEKGVGSGFVLNGATLVQDIVNAPQYHMISTIVKKGIDGAGYIKVTYDNGLFEQVDFLDGTSYDYVTVEIPIETSSNTITVELYGDVDSSIIFTGTMANVGQVALQWQHSAGEIYNTNVLMDLNGIRVISSSYNGYTAITPEEFAGYAEVPNDDNELEMQRVFTLNKDVTEMSKVKADKEIGMAPIKIIPVSTVSYTGWAFVADE